MAIIKFMNKRTEETCEIYHNYFFHFIEEKIKKILPDEIFIEMQKENKVKFETVSELLEFLGKKRCSRILDKREREQSYEGIVHNTLKALNKEYTIFSYIYNEIQGYKSLIIEKKDFDIVLKELKQHLIDNKDGRYIDSFIEFEKDLKEDDIIYAYDESENYNLWNVSAEDVTIGMLEKKKCFLDLIKYQIKGKKDYSLNDFLEELKEYLVDEVEEYLTEEELSEIYESKMVRVNKKDLEDYYFENNYNILTILKEMEL